MVYLSQYCPRPYNVKYQEYPEILSSLEEVVRSSLEEFSCDLVLLSKPRISLDSLDELLLEECRLSFSFAVINALRTRPFSFALPLWPSSTSSWSRSCGPSFSSLTFEMINRVNNVPNRKQQSQANTFISVTYCYIMFTIAVPLKPYWFSFRGRSLANAHLLIVWFVSICPHWCKSNLMCHRQHVYNVLVSCICKKTNK